MMPGIYGESQFSVNSLGIRGNELNEGEFKYRILAFGGSTTECLYLDDLEAWPHLLQTQLNEKGKKVWIGNVGKSGYTLIEILEQMKEKEEFLDTVNIVLLLTGINDLQRSLYETNNYSESKKWDSTKQFFRHTALWALTRRVRDRFMRNHLIQDNASERYLISRKNRQEAEIIREELPDLSADLDQYKKRLNNFIDMALKHEIKPILMTQPSIYREDLTTHEMNLLWFGWVNGDQTTSATYYSLKALKTGLNIFNQIVLEVCNERQLECLDLANILPRDLSIFYDDVHFNENGAREVAKTITQFFMDKKF